MRPRPRPSALAAATLVVGACQPAYDDATKLAPNAVELVPIVLAHTSEADGPPYVRSPSQRDPVAFAQPLYLALTDSAGVEVAVELGRGRPARLRFDPGRHVVIVLPSVWRVATAAAVVPVSTMPLLPSPSGAGSLLAQDPVLWHRFPITVVVRGSDHASPRGVRARAVEEAIANINRMAGGRVFEYRGIKNAAGRESGVTVELSDTLPGVLGRTRIHEVGCTFQGAEGFHCSPRWASGATVWLSPLAGLREIEHELLHTLGLGHTCVVPSVLATEFEAEELRRCGVARSDLGTRSPLPLERRLSHYDAAAIQIVATLADRMAGQRADSVHWLVSGSHQQASDWP